MYTQEEKQNRQAGWIPVPVFTGINFPFAGMTKNSGITKDTNTNLKTLSNDQLLFQTKSLVQKERQINIQVLQHLQEIEYRKLYLKRGFSSLFEYTVKELGYSESSAYRRIKAMKLCKELPETKLKMAKGELNLCTASKLQTVFEKQEKQIKNKVMKQQATITKILLDKNKKTQSNQRLIDDAPIIHNEESLHHQVPISKAQKRDLIKQVQGKSTKETEKLLSSTFPEVCSEKEKVRDINNNKVEIKVILDKDSQQKLEDLKKLLSHKNPNMSYGELFTLLAELGLNKYDPKRKINKKIDWIPAYAGMTTSISKRTTSMESEKTVDKKPQKTSAQKHNQKLHNKQKHLKTIRYIPSVVRHHVWMRDQGQCTYVCPKTRCTSRHLLQVDHIKPFSLGGTHEADNLRLLCANHNQFTFSRYQKYKQRGDQ